MRDGFTLVELLVVIVIIALLTGMVTVGVVMVLKASKVSSTEAFLGNIAGAANQYQIRWGDWPPTTLAEVGGRARNDVNSGVEVLVAALSSRKRGAPLLQPNEEHYGNADRDTADRNVTDWFFGDNQLREYRDFFGNAVWYIHNRNYASPRPEHLKVQVSEDAKEGKAAVGQSPATATFINPGRFQLRSAGPDGQFGTPDDIWPASW